MKRAPRARNHTYRSRRDLTAPYPFFARATAIAVVMLVTSFVLLLGINVIQWWANRHNTTSLA